MNARVASECRAGVLRLACGHVVGAV
jgi:hypothetical protein